MDKYTKDIILKFDIDKNSLDSAEAQAKQISQIFGKQLFDASNLKDKFNEFVMRRGAAQQTVSLMKQYQNATGEIDGRQINAFQNTLEKLIAGNEALENEFAEYRKEASFKDKVKSFFSKENIKDFFSKETAKDFFTDGAKLLANHIVQAIKIFNITFDDVIDELGNTIKNAWQTMSKMMQSSYLTNLTTRDNLFSYGLNASQSYGLEQAKSMFGISNTEDLQYLQGDQQTKFYEVMTKYADKYNSLADRGFFDDMLDFQIEMQEFQLDVQMEFIEFFMENKDTIKQAFELLIWGMKTIVEGIDGILNILSFGSSEESKLASMNDIVQSVTRSSTINVNQTNTTTLNRATDSQATAYVNTLNSSIVEAIKSLGGN